MQQTFGNGGHLAKGRERELQKFWKCRKGGERFVYFIFDGLTLYILFLQFIYQIHFILFNRVYLLEREIIRTGLSIHTKNREIMSFVAHLIAQGSITLFNPITAATLLIYVYGTIYIRELFKNEKFTRKEFKYLPNCICISKIYPLFFRVLKFILYWFINVISMFSLKIIKFI